MTSNKVMTTLDLFFWVPGSMKGWIAGSEGHGAPLGEKPYREAGWQAELAVAGKPGIRERKGEVGRAVGRDRAQAMMGWKGLAVDGCGPRRLFM